MTLGKLTTYATIVTAGVLWFATMAAAQTAEPQNSPDFTPAQQQNLPANQLPDFRLLNLTQEQIQKIREINQEVKDERQAAVMKQRLAQRALAQAIESPNPDEKLIAQRSREVAEAQANTIRLRSLVEARILQILSPEQRLRLREMRQRNVAQQRAIQQQKQNQRQGFQRGANQLLTPAQRRALRRQPRPQF